VRALVDLPKAHLHLHLEGSMRPATLAELAEREGVEVPPIEGFGSFAEFVGTYVAATTVIATPDDLRRLFDEVVEDAALAGAVWVEPAFYAVRHTERLGPLEGVYELALDALAEAAARHGIAAGLMVSANRTDPPEQAVELAQVASRLVDRGVVSFGLANDEAAWPPEPFADAFRIAKGAGLLSTPHAGELAGPDSVRGALDALGADRIQHGVRALEDPELVRRLADEGVTCDVCPTSNVLLSVAPSLEACGLGPLLDAGVRCSVNADDPLLFGTGLLGEYELCRDALGFDDDRLATIARTSVEASGAPADVKLSALTGIEAWATAGSSG
jgi:adenosine deaminase